MSHSRTQSPSGVRRWRPLEWVVAAVVALAVTATVADTLGEQPPTRHAAAAAAGQV